MSDAVFDLRGRTAIVTGAARGIGLAVAQRMVAAGAVVWMADMDDEALLPACAEVGGEPIVADVSSTAGAERIVVVNVTSYTGLHGNVGQSAYAAAKAGVIGFTKTAAKELGRFGITVNAISPNAQTRMIESIPAETLETLRGQIALGRFAQPEEIAAGVLFLASEEAGYVTGAVLPIDGGISM
ncbi:MAG TPA: SDR family oxidoreductase [Solirubrobacterales bacterium]|jgi:3-oxoacyl-[acyl-carrier protein] reductase|nr:SDR family oxidoreductase [Solirubrobacterales bacterium]